MSSAVIVDMLKVDLHSHLLFGIDDGAHSLEESIAMITALNKIGFKKLIMTPHTMMDAYPNMREGILNQLEIVKRAVAPRDINVSLEAASEYYLDEGFAEHLDGNPLLIGGVYLLFETSYMRAPLNMEALIYEIASRGYKPLLAHPERYRYIKDMERAYGRLKELGVSFQLDTNSMGGFYGKDALKKAQYLIENGMVDFVGSDTHSMRHIANLSVTLRASKIWEKLFAKNTILNHTLADVKTTGND